MQRSKNLEEDEEEAAMEYYYKRVRKKSPTKKRKSSPAKRYKPYNAYEREAYRNLYAYPRYRSDGFFSAVGKATLIFVAVALALLAVSVSRTARAEGLSDPIVYIEEDHSRFIRFGPDGKAHLCTIGEDQATVVLQEWQGPLPMKIYPPL